MTSTVPRDPEEKMDFWYSSPEWKNILRADKAETIGVPPCLDVLKGWIRNDPAERAEPTESSSLASNILGQEGEAVFKQKFHELNIGGILVCGLKSCDLVASLIVPKKIIQKGEWDAIFFHQNRGIFVIEVKATKTNDRDALKRPFRGAKEELDKNIENIKQSLLWLGQKECSCITGFICFPFRNEGRKTFEGYRVIDKLALNDQAIFRKFFEPETNSSMIEVSLLQRLAAAFVCCRSQVEFHSQAYNAIKIANWIKEQNIKIKRNDQKKHEAKNEDQKNIRVNIPGNGPSGKIILTKEQLDIVECRENCITICGAPGSGKTLILMLRALKAAKEDKAGAVFVFVHEKLKAKYENYFFEEAGNIKRKPKIHTIDKINFAKPEDDIFFDETPVEDSYIKMIKSRMIYGGGTTVVFTGMYKPGEAVDSFYLYQPQLQQFRHFELMKVLRCSAKIFDKWEHYYTHGITMGHGIAGVEVQEYSLDSFEQVQKKIAIEIETLTNTNIRNTDLPSLKKEHIAVITCDDNDSTEMRNYFETKEILCGQVNEQARRLKNTSIVAVDVYLNTLSYEWPIVFIILKPGVAKEEVLPIAASRCIACLTLIKYKNASPPSLENLNKGLKRPSNESIRHGKGQNNIQFGLGMIPIRLVWLAVICLLLACGVYTARNLYMAYSKEHKIDTYHGECSSYSNLPSIQSSLRDIYLKSYRSVIPVSSAPFFFDIDEKWVNLTLTLDGSTITEDYADLIKKAFAKADMLIIEGDPGMGKSSITHRIQYEWSQSRLCDYDLVLYIEFRKLREYEFKDIKELIIHYMKGYLDEQDYEMLHHFINETKCCKEHKILVLLDGYDESALEKQCQELSNFFTSTTSRPLQFKVLLTSRKGYLSKLRNQGRFIFADITGFTTDSQRQEFIAKHFNATNDIKLSENTAAVINLLNTNANLKRLSETPLMLTFICLLHNKIIDGTEVELYMNIIWWMIDRYQKSNPNKDVPSLFGFQHDESDRFRVIETDYLNFPQLHMLGTMAMQDIFKTTFIETDLTKFQLKEIVQEVGFLRKEVTRDETSHTKTKFAFTHRTIQEFITALHFFFSNKKPPIDFIWYVFMTATNKGYGIIQVKLQIYLNMIYSNKIKINESKKTLYSTCMKISSQLNSSPRLEHGYMSAINSHDVANLTSQNNQRIPQSSEELIQLLQYEGEKGDAFAQCSLGLMYEYGVITKKSYKDAVKWYTKSAQQGNLDAQYNLGFMHENGKGLSKSDEEAVKWYTRSAVQGNIAAQSKLGFMHKNGKGVPQSDVDAVKWFKISAEQGDADAQCNLGFMHEEGKGVPKSDEEAFKWYTKSAEQGNAIAQFKLGIMYEKGKGVPKSDEEAVKWYKISAEQGNAEAQNNLGLMYENGKGVPQSNAEAVIWFTKSAEQGNADAQCNLGSMYAEGKGVPKSDEEAVKWYTKSAKQGNAVGQNNLGFMYRNGQGIPQSDAEAFKWYTKSAEQGNAVGHYNLGLMYENGKGVPQSNAEALKCYTKSAEQGDADAQCNLGSMYAEGKGVPKSDEEAVKWYTKSAKQGNAVGQNNLGFMYRNGQGIPQSDAEAFKWYTKSAEQGNAVGQNNLGFMYRNGQGVPQSDAEAFKWYTKSAEQGNAEAQNNLGLMYENGKGVPQSNAEAVIWFTKSAEQGNADAQCNLGSMYAEGKGVPKSDEEAVKWYTKSAKQGNAVGQNNLGFMYRNGQGVPQSDAEAFKWYTKSAEQGNAEAQNNVGLMYENGKGVPQSNAEAVIWFTKSAEQGNADAQFKLGIMHENGKGVPQSNAEAVIWYTKSAKQGNAAAQSNLREILKKE